MPPDPSSHRVVRTALDRRNEAVTAAMKRLHVPGTFGGISKRRPQALDRGVDAVLEVDDCAIRPQPGPELVTGHDVAGALQEQAKNLERLLLEAHAHLALPELPGAKIHLIAIKPHDGPIHESEHR